MKDLNDDEKQLMAQLQQLLQDEEQDFSPLLSTNVEQIFRHLSARKKRVMNKPTAEIIPFPKKYKRPM